MFRIKSVVKIVFTLAVTALMIYALSTLDTESLIYSLKRVSLQTVLIMVGMQIFSQFLVTWQWYKISEFAGVPLSFLDMLVVNSQGTIIDSITPGVKVGGEVTRALQIKNKSGCSGEQAAAVVAVQKLFSLGVFFLPLLIIVFAAPNRIMNALKKSGKRNQEPGRIKRFVLAFLEQVISLRKNKRFFTAQLLLSAAIWLIYPLKLYILAAHTVEGVGVLFVIVTTYAAYLVAMFTIFPGGLGGFEGTMTGMLLTAGFSQNDAFVVAVLFRFFSFWLVMLFSIAFLFVYKISAKKINPNS
ncbi:MAG: flippase-like domain-containing protein [Oscillospiraceae bacterium]|nr:flippase-like domain-containing protein [Oscillospiraceae bacterium]